MKGPRVGTMPARGRPPLQEARTVSWDRRDWSVVIHAEHTHTGPSDSGTAGARLACLDVGS